MIQLNKILFATDFSESADRAKLMACEFAAQFGAELHLLHVIHDAAVDVPEFGMGLSFPSFVDNVSGKRHELKEKALSRLSAEVDDSWRKQHRVVLGTRFGKEFLEIIRYARDNEIDLIVVGSHGRTGLTHALLGSVAEKLVRKAPCPVLTVRQPKQQPDTGDKQVFPPGVHPLPVG